MTRRISLASSLINTLKLERDNTGTPRLGLEILVANFFNLYGIVAKNPFDASIELPEQTIFRANESSANSLSSQGVAILKSVIEQQIMPVKPTATGVNRGST